VTGLDADRVGEVSLIAPMRTLLGKPALPRDGELIVDHSCAPTTSHCPLMALSTTTILSFATSLALDDHPSKTPSVDVACPTYPAAGSDCDSGDSSLMSCSSDRSSINILPPELVCQILAEVATARFETFVVEGQFEEIETQCRVNNLAT
jgi:hypothetical protein